MLIPPYTSCTTGYESLSVQTIPTKTAKLSDEIIIRKIINRKQGRNPF